MPAKLSRPSDLILGLFDAAEAVARAIALKRKKARLLFVI